MNLRHHVHGVVDGSAQRVVGRDFGLRGAEEPGVVERRLKYILLYSSKAKEGERAHTRGRVTVEQEAQTAVPKSTRKSMREKHAHCQSCLAILSCTHTSLREFWVSNSGT